MLLFSAEAYRRCIPRGGMSRKTLEELDGQAVIDGVAEWVDEKGELHRRAVRPEWCEELGRLGLEAVVLLARQRDDARRLCAKLYEENVQLRMAMNRAARR